MMTLMSSGARSSAPAKFSGASRRVTRRSSHERSARNSASPVLYQCRLLALTLPTTTVLLRRAARGRRGGAGRARSRRAAARNAGQGHVARASGGLNCTDDELRDPGGLDDDVRFEADVPNARRMGDRAEGTHELRFGSGLDPV